MMICTLKHTMTAYNVHNNTIQAVQSANPRPVQTQLSRTLHLYTMGKQSIMPDCNIGM